jgi:hypothetical protein
MEEVNSIQLTVWSAASAIYTVGESSLNCAIVSGLQRRSGRFGKILPQVHVHVPVAFGPVTSYRAVSHVWD